MLLRPSGANKPAVPGSPQLADDGACYAVLVTEDAELTSWVEARLAVSGWALRVTSDAGQVDEELDDGACGLLLVDLATVAADRSAARELLRRAGQRGIRRLAVAADAPPDPSGLLQLGADDGLPRPTSTAAVAEDARLAESRLGTALTAAEATLLQRRLARLEGSLDIERAFFGGIFDAAPEGVVVVDASQRIIRANAAFCELFGYTPDEILGGDVDALIAPPPYAAEAQALSARVRAGEEIAVEAIRCRKDGTELHISLLATPIHVPNGKVGTLGIYRDISAQKAAEAALQRRNQEFQALVENSPDVIARIDRDFRYVYVNSSVAWLSGHTPRECRGRDKAEIGLPPDAVGAWTAAASEVFATGREARLEYEAELPSGKAWLQARLLPEFATDGTVESVLEITRDATAQKRAEHALRESAEFYRHLFERNPQPMWVYDCETLRFLAVNQAASAAYGYSKAEFLSMTIQDIRPPDEVPKLLDNIAHAPRTGFERSGLWRHRTRGGEERWVEVISHDLVYADRAARLVLANDVTARKAMESALRDSEQRYRTLFDQSPLGVVHFGHDLKVLACNRGLSTMLGRPAEEMVGFDLNELRDRRLLPALRRTLAGKTSRYEGPYRTLPTKRLVWIAVHLAPLHDSAGRVQGGIAVIEDVTARRHAEERLGLQARQLEAVNAELLARSAELEEALSGRQRLYAAMNHELRTPVSSILLYIDLLLSGAFGTLEATQREGLESVQRSAQHLSELVADLLDLASLEAGKLSVRVEPVEVAGLVRDLVATIAPMAAQAGSFLESCLCDDGSVIHTDGRRLRQILLNLVSNAAKFGEGKAIQVACERIGGGGIEVRVRDHGRGIAPEDRARIFDEFVQVGAPREGGTGLGLAISKRLAELLGGSLEVESTLGEGSTFRLRLPHRPPDGADAREADAPDAPPA